MIPMISFIEPERLWWMLLIPVLPAAIVLLRRKSARKPHQWHHQPDRVLPKQQARKRHIAVGAAVLSLAALNVAFVRSRPIRWTCRATAPPSCSPSTCRAR